ncbi:hypothetical protein BgiBS90_026506 [Biomphalaria glabrata]|nr:hypothetical protein BgiBS90_026506 [Biomphalaria glabrata]
MCIQHIVERSAAGQAGSYDDEMKLRALLIFISVLTYSCAQGVFEFPAVEGNPITMDCSYSEVQWLVTNNNYTRVVANCANTNCTNNEPNDYLASIPSTGSKKNSLLLVKSVRRPGLEAQCRVNNTFTAYFWKLRTIVKPTIPNCNVPVPQSDGQTIHVQCNTFVYPSALCNIYLQGQLNVSSRSSTYNNTWSVTNNLTFTTCLLSFQIKDAVWNSSAVFRVGVYPDVNLGYTYEIYNNWSLLLVPVQDRPKVIAVTANQRSGYLLVINNSPVTIRCVAIGQTGSTFSLYNQATNQVLATTTIPQILEYNLTNVIELRNTIIRCQVNGAEDSRKFIHLYYGAGNSPVTSFTANWKSDVVTVTQGSDVSVNCTGDDIQGYKLILSYHFLDGFESVMDEAELPDNILHVFHNIPCGNLSYLSCRVDNDSTTEKLINITVECVKSSCCDLSSSFPIIPVAAGVASGVALIILIIIIVCACRHCRSNNKKSDTKSKVTSNISLKRDTTTNIDNLNTQINFMDYIDNKTINSNLNRKGSKDSSVDRRYSSPLPNTNNLLRNTPKRMSITRNSTRKKLAASLYSESSIHNPNEITQNQDIYYINSGYVSSSDTSLHQDMSSSSSSVTLPPSYRSVTISSKDYDVPYSVVNRTKAVDISQKPTNHSTQSKPIVPYQREYDLPYGHEYRDKSTSNAPVRQQNHSNSRAPSKPQRLNLAQTKPITELNMSHGQGYSTEV